MNLEKELLNYIQNIKKVSSETAKSHQFLIMMEKIFPGSTMGYIENLFPEMEKYVSFKTKTIVVRGRIDSLLGNVIIEFESDVRKMKERAEEQLKRYVSILWNNELKELKKRVSYIAIATDGIEFYVYRPDTIKQEEIREEDVELIPIEEFNIERSNPEEILRWLDITFLSKEMRAPTTEEFKYAFGVGTAFYVGAFREMEKAIDKFKKESREAFETLFFEWSKYLSIAYGSTIENVDFFIKHTYLSMLSKLMVYSFFSKGEIPIRDETILDILNGKVFEKWQIKNFFEEDFFSWIIRDPVKEIGIKIARGILDVLVKYDLTKLNEDILKGLYENLLDPKERHDLGEVYTPDWLVEYILRDLLKENPKASVLDPACGSGTFLFITIKLKKEFLKDKMDEVELLYHILENVKGIDIHPLAILIAKTNYLIALGDLLKTKRREVVLPIYMADSIKLIDEDKSNLGGIQVYKIPTIDDKTFFFLPCDFIEKRMLSPEAIDLLIDLIRELSEEFLKTGEIYKERIGEFLYKHIRKDEAKKYINVLVQNVKIFAEKIIKRNKDTIWGYILKNKHKPLDFTYRKFDLIVGNPPWVIYKFIKNVHYQNFIKKLILKDYKLVERGELIAGMEIATLFFIRCVELYLSEKGKIAFVMPRTIFSAYQHSKFRTSTYERVNIKFIKILDLEKVKPLFKVQACVIIAERGNPKYPINAEIIEGNLERKNENYENAIPLLKIRKSNLFLSRSGEAEFFSYKRIEFQGKSPYHDKFFVGATLYPRPFWFVEILESKLGFSHEKPAIKTLVREGITKPSWDKIQIEGNVEKMFLYATILGLDLFPFSYKISLVLLPVIQSHNQFLLVKKEEAIKKYPGIATWLEKVEMEWKNIRKEKIAKMDIYKRLDYAKGLTKQNPNKNIKVIYSTHGKNLVAAVIKVDEIKKKNEYVNNFIADYKTLVFEPEVEDEAYFLASILNSRTLNELIKPMQPKGLYGERSIIKRVWEFPIPQFSKNNENHKKLAKLGKIASEKAQQKLEEILEKEYKHLEYLKPQHVARIRKEIREYIKDELEEIDKIVQEILRETPKAEGLNKFINK
jgi:methylase of polypeptide subunit release factors